MQLIGMLDSPYVRRVAVSLQLLGLPFEHRSVSVFGGYEQFRAINPVVKAPTLVCDDGTVLMESTLILDYAEHLADPDKSLMPRTADARVVALRAIGLSLAACEKSIQIVYERNLRPPEKQHEPWLSRVSGQLIAAFTALEAMLREGRVSLRDGIDQAAVCAAVAWHFSRNMVADVLSDSAFAALREFSAAAEQRAEFRAAPHGSGIYPVR